MNDAVITRLRAELDSLRAQGLFKGERVLEGPQGGVVEAGGREVINLCANNYLGLANHPAVRAAAQRALDEYGYGMASVRFICGTQQTHKELERRLARFLGTEDVILYSSCFDANGGLFETLLDERDAVISDALNHASIIDGIRLCKAQRQRYANSDLGELEKCLQETQGARTRLIATDGVFSMDGIRCPPIATAKRYDALSWSMTHATGSWAPPWPRHARALRRRRARRHPHRHARQGPRRGQRRLRRPPRSHRVAAAALATVPVLQQIPPWSPVPALRCSICSRTARSCAPSCLRTRSSSAPDWRSWALTSNPVSIPSSR
jgi:hypothetical protein